MAAIRIEGLTEVLRQIADLEQLKPVRQGILAAALYLKGKVAVYPPRAHLTRAGVYGSTFKSDKQRRYFFAALKRGEIEVPYRRGESPGSETFGRRWAVEVDAGGLRATVGNNASYGPLLMDEEKQSLFMRAAGWRTVQAIVREEQEEVVRIVTEGMQAAMGK